MGEPDPLMEGYSNRCKSVFNFEQVTIKSATSPEEKDSGPDPSKRKSVSTSEDRFYKPPPKRCRPDPPDEETDVAPVKTEDFKGRESLFRVPDHEWKKPAPRENQGLDVAQFRKPRGRGGFRGRGGGRGGRLPDFAKNPEKYTKYSLKDVDLPNNRSNSEAAFAFLDSLKQRSQEPEEKFDTHQSDQKIVFKKPTKKRSGGDAPASTLAPSSSSSGHSAASGTKTKTSSGPTLSFDMEDEEDED